MFGRTQLEHDARYRYGAEWLAVVTRLWEDDAPFDHDGEFFRLTAVQGAPKPGRRPILLNAGTSEAAMDFAARDVDFLFGVPPTVDAMRRLVVDARARAAAHDRDLSFLSCALIIARDTLDEAQAAYDDVLARGDWEGAASAMEILSLHSGSFEESIRDFATRFIVGFGTHVIVGTPATVTEELRCIADTGTVGVLLGFVDFETELDYFGARIMPLLREAGLRI
jgi:alkanesulfonate monooxygenase SsuD/methylene tetrahydromethanopterin reductase-like flavin-dependent oxidoreductase (luciferase family)